LKSLLVAEWSIKNLDSYTISISVGYQEISDNSIEISLTKSLYFDNQKRWNLKFEIKNGNAGKLNKLINLISYKIKVDNQIS